MNGTDKNYQVEARTRTCDVLHDTRPVSTPFNRLSQDSLLAKWVRGYARRLVWFDPSPFFGTPLYYFVLGGKIYLHLRSLWVRRRLATPNICSSRISHLKNCTNDTTCTIWTICSNYKTFTTRLIRPKIWPSECYANSLIVSTRELDVLVMVDWAGIR